MVSPFEYITVLISIILGMGITQILSGVAGIILRWDQVKLYWPHCILILLVFVFHIQEWWVTYDLRTYAYWRLPIFLFTILYPVNLYILARILFPLRWSGASVDMKQFYFQNFRRIFVFVLSLAVLSIIDNISLTEIKIEDQLPQTLVAAISALIIFSDVRLEWVHQLIIMFLLLATVIAFVVEWDVLLIVNK
ncbi:MAG TPA: hypothetical protein VIN08_19820 [Ohtaekwangia sp.]|uniref:hypothetical protein n=1 Tax=Ohtaekwangia sp. TaxID=2066019 RepID=UPI002F92B938